MQAKASILNNSSHYLKQDDDVAIRAINLGKCYHIYDKPQDRLKQAFLWGRKKLFRDFWALKDVSFEVKKGETLGIIGKNGSGKSTLLQLICGILTPTVGEIERNGRVAAILELGAGFNPEFNGRENVYMNASIFGLSKDEIDSRYEGIVTFADIGDFINQPIKTYSSGMVIRLAFACAVSVDPDILIIDEALAVGDMQFQKKCMRKMDEFKSKDKTILFVSHSLYTVRVFCDRCIWFKNGQIVGDGESDDVVNQYLEEIEKREQNDLREKDSERLIRTGTGDAMVIKARLLDDSENEKEEFKTGDNLILEITYLAKEEIKKPTFGYSIFVRNENLRVTTDTSKWENCSPSHISGQGVVRIYIDRIPLLPKDYSIVLGIRDEYEVITYDRVENMVDFRIVEGDGKKGNLSTVGFLYYPARWQFL